MTKTTTSTRITKADLDGRVQVIRRILGDDNVYLDEGSKLYGRAFRLRTVRDGVVATPVLPDSGFAGWTKGEAYDKLTEFIASL